CPFVAGAAVTGDDQRDEAHDHRDGQQQCDRHAEEQARDDDGRRSEDRRERGAEGGTEQAGAAGPAPVAVGVECRLVAHCSKPPRLNWWPAPVATGASEPVRAELPVPELPDAAAPGLPESLPCGPPLPTAALPSPDGVPF